MSFAKLEEIKCPCGEIFEAELWNAINVTEDPDLREALLCGEINVVCCPACNEMFYAEHFVLYHDSANEIIAFVYPLSFSHQAAHWERKMKEDFERACADMSPDERVNYEPLLLFGIEKLAELVRSEEADMDEASVLEYIAGDLGLDLARIRPSMARQLQIPRVLPLLRGKSSDMREEVLAGLEKLLKHNENLMSYNRLRHLIEHNKNWYLDKKLIRK